MCQIKGGGSALCSILAHKTFALPALKLTRRPARGKKRVEYLYRGMPEPKLKNLSSSTSSVDIIDTQSVCQEASLSTFDEHAMQLKVKLLLLGGKTYGLDCLMQ